MILRRNGARRKCAAVIVTVATAGAVLVGAGGTPAGATAPRQTGGTIKVMVIAQLTAGASGATTPGAPAAVKARVKIANKKKELPGGQKITVEVCDDHENANTAAACARQAVSDGVVAVVGSASSQDDAVNPILQAAGIANIGEDPISPSDFANPISFPLQATTAGYICGSLIALKKKNITKADIAYIDIPAGAQTVTIAKLCSGPIGVPTVNGTPVPPTSPDLTSAVTAAAEGGDGIVLATLASSAAQFIKTAKQQNVTKPIYNNNSGFTADTLKQLGNAADGTFVTDSYAPLTSKAPGIRAFLLGMKKYAKGVQIEDVFGLGGWLGMDVFIRMAKTQNLTDITAASVLSGMGKITNLDTGGIIPPLTTTTPFPLPPLARVFNRYVYPAVVKNGKVVGTGPAYDALSVAVGG